VDFTRRFKAARDFYKAQVGTKMKLEKMAKNDDKWDETDANTVKECHDQENGRLMALLYMENADQNKYGSVIKGLMDQYPKTGDMGYMCTTYALVKVYSWDKTFPSIEGCDGCNQELSHSNPCKRILGVVDDQQQYQEGYDIFQPIAAKEGMFVEACRSSFWMLYPEPGHRFRDILEIASKCDIKRM
jgi:hypothetical protein